MAQVPGMDRGVRGKTFVPLMFLGVVIFSIVMGFGTYWIAEKSTPFFKARFARQMAAERAAGSTAKTP